MANKKEQKKLRLAIIDYDKCDTENCGVICLKSCPGVRMKQDTIIINPETGKPNISEDLCTGCGICVHKCPTNAISIINLTSELASPLHQYGQNEFRLYRLPLPKEGSVVGLIGKNATGKSTALKIISGEIIPNLGRYDENPSYDSAIEFFKGKELQAFFEKLRDKGVKISSKPQNIDELPKIAKGNVGELLKKVDERKKLKEVEEQLNLTHLLERSLAELSGGELQRTAIAAAVLKDADIYAFDEPSSYLDVSERLKIAKIIRSLAESGKSVIVIEHDLAVLDYLSDYIHILYGKPAAYGIVSNPKSLRNGINEFLEGFISDENVRFRSKEIKFEVRPPSSPEKGEVIAEYPALKKKFSNFELSTEAGELHAGEVIGILGPNAIGKTTFVKMLASELQPDEGKIDFKLRVSHKPQYIIPEKGITVRQLFSGIKYDKELFKAEIDRRLGITELNEKNLTELSGGELQRVAVALALSRDADLMLLDEPSAFVDVEDRLKVADAIRAVVEKTGKTAMVVDHDILFQDYVSSRLMIFEGEQGRKGKALKPMPMHEGMNLFLKNLNISFRRDPETGRPRANKPDSVKDAEQKKEGEYYYKF